MRVAEENAILDSDHKKLVVVRLRLFTELIFEELCIRIVQNAQLAYKCMVHIMSA